MVSAKVALRLIAAFSIFTTLCMVASAQEAPDYPSAPRFPGYTEDAGTHTDFDAYDFDLGNEKSKHVEGKSWHMSYALMEGKRTASPLELLRNYANIFK